MTAIPGIVASEPGTANATANAAAINAAISAATLDVGGGELCFPWPTSSQVYNFDSSITTESGITLYGSGVQGAGPILNYVGADGTHAIVAAAGCSKGRIAGIRLIDGRTSPTGGCGIHCTVTNGLIIENLGVFTFPGDAIYVGASTGTPDNYTIRNVWAQSTAGYGVTCDHASENVLLEDIKGDSDGRMKALIRLMGHSGGGFTNVVIIGAKSEIIGTPSPAPDLVYIDSTFTGRVTLIGGFLGGHGGYIVNNQASTVVLNILGTATVGPSSGVLHTAAAGTLYHRSTSVAVSAGQTIGDGTIVRNVGSLTFIGVDADAATI